MARATTLPATIARTTLFFVQTPVEDVQIGLMTAVDGTGQIIEGRERYSVLVRYPRELRDDPQQLGAVLVATPSGGQIPLSQLASIEVVRGSTLIKSENAGLNNFVYVDVRGRDIGGYVDDARALLEQRLPVPSGYRLESSGQFEALERAGRSFVSSCPSRSRSYFCYSS